MAELIPYASVKMLALQDIFQVSLQTSKKWMDITVGSLTRSKLSLLTADVSSHLILWNGSNLAASVALQAGAASVSKGGERGASEAEAMGSPAGRNRSSRAQERRVRFAGRKAARQC